jgi:hypothetical protein
VIEAPAEEQPAEDDVKTPSKKKKAAPKKSSTSRKKAAAPKKAAAKKTAGKPKAGPKTARRAKPAPNDAVIVWRGRKNPFRRGRRRARADGAPARARRQDRRGVHPAGGKRGTVGTCRTRGLVKLT